MAVPHLSPKLPRNGFTMVEVLVSLLVLSVGLLGSSKLVLLSSRSNVSAYMRSQATALAYEMLDNMRANATAVQAGNYTIAPAWVSTAASNPGTSCNQTSTCVNSVLAQLDLYYWQQDLLHALGPSGNGTINITTSTDAVTGALYTNATVTVQWDDTVAQSSFNPGSATAQQLVLETVL